MNCLSIINELASTTKRLQKEAILKREFNNEQLKKVFWAAYNPDITFWIQKHPSVIEFKNKILELEDALRIILEQIATRQVTGNAAIEKYQMILCMVSQDDAEVIRRIIDRDLRCGVNVPTINKIWKGLIPVYELMLAENKPNKLKFPDVVVQLKYDGLRCLITHTKEGDIVLRTRNGNQITSLSLLNDEFKQIIPVEKTFDGELVCYIDDNPLSRKISNGILNKAIRNTITQSDIEKIRFLCWDIIDQTQTIPYKIRLRELNKVFKKYIGKIVKKVKSEQVNTILEVDELFQQALDNGYEGVIAKNLNAVWQPKRTGDLCKFKAELTADLVVVEWEEGLGRNSGRLGALVCESSDGKIRVNVGSGFSDKQRNQIKKEDVIGRIVEVKYNARISKKTGEIDSLYLPVFLKFRDFEKTIANSSDEIL